ncbi:tripartite tricarboxylate transporter TctB family protein [Aeromicrobium piscarium]|uniref:tripartite tricarboxylate transporter TctB family protein n=1 Tax=Aeromicrobium piscarium TaxID=2590901 RepID=UPI001C8F4CE4|nr:tripartite tricarboxylate transporter TctB family protein [Aeromicrobium piscarium]
MPSGELIAYAVLTAVGVYATVNGVSYRLVEPSGAVGPGMMPAASGVVIVGLSLILMVRVLRSSGAGRGVTAEELAAASEDDVIDPPREHRAWVVIGLMVVTALLMNVLGLLPALGILVVVVVGFVERRSWTRAVAVGLITVVVLYLVFDQLLGVPLPTGLLGGVI